AGKGYIWATQVAVLTLPVLVWLLALVGFLANKRSPGGFTEEVYALAVRHLPRGFVAERMARKRRAPERDGSA
ncbi:hypothetical protein ACWDA9_29105, partial [Streptomyces sp. NPDC001193]